MPLPPPATVYDSAQRHPPLVTQWTNLRRHWGLVRLLVTRDLTVRYKRSVLGVWWTLLNPLLTTAVMWLVFSAVFRFQIPDDVPYIVYLLSGVLLVTFFAQGVLAVGSSIVNSSNILTKVYVPPETFAFAASTAAAANFALGLGPLMLVQVFTGVGIPWTVLLIPLPMLGMLLFVAGLGLLVAALAVYFHDVLDLTRVLVQLVSYATPTFYPLAIIPADLRIIIELNPLYSFLLVIRHLAYLGTMPPVSAIAMAALSAAVALTIGSLVFHRVWRRLVALL